MLYHDIHYVDVEHKIEVSMYFLNNDNLSNIVNTMT